MKNALLPASAERYLRALEGALWPLGSDERETILLELRGHLAGCAARGPDRLADALASLGTPEECARAFVDEGAGDTYRRAGLPGRALVPVGLPPEIAAATRSMSFASVLRDIQATFRASGDQLWAIGALVMTFATATNFLIYIHALRPGTIELWPVMLVRVAVLLIAIIAAYRTILDDRRHPWAFDLASIRASLGIVALLLCASAATFFIKTLLELAGASFAVRALAVSATLLGVSLLFLRLQPWIVALAIGRAGVTPRRVLAGTRGRMPAILKGWAMTVLPLTLLHHASALIVRATDRVEGLHLLLAGLDGIVTMGIVLGGALLNSTVFRWTVGEPIPAPRPFATGEPDDSLVEQARVRLQRHIDPRRA